ncbi:MAG: fibronectin type III domain-containing protein [Sedimentisphaerales bacterium]|nr:fibronectin type III domain-containing protein [Sedimentisphaerales bacterium]
MSSRFFCRVLLIAVVVVGILGFTSDLFAQGRSQEALEHVRQVQARNTERLMSLKDIEGTAIGLDNNDQLVLQVFAARPGVKGIPGKVEGIPVQVVVTGKFYALQKPYKVPPGLDKKVPKAPSGLIATALSSTEIGLSWVDNSSNEAGFNIERWNGVVFVEIATVGANVTTFIDSGLSEGTTYTYRVCAYNSAGASSYSNEASATTPGGTILPPAAPTGLTAIAVSSSQINLSWTDNSNNETGFGIEWSTDDVSFSWLADVGANVETYSDIGLEPSTTYYYRVYSYNSVYESGYSNMASGTTFAYKPPRWCVRPVPIGVSTGHPDITAGTIGCRVKYGNTVYALSNNHVYANENLGICDVDNVLQPGPFDGGINPDDAIGTLFDFEPVLFLKDDSSNVNTIDAAIAKTTTAFLGNATPPDGYGVPSSSTAAATWRLKVKKYGRTTGLTNGRVVSTNATVDVGYDTGVARFVGQIVVSPGTFSAGGDSGSLIVTSLGNRPVGLLFAGSDAYTIANPIDAVLDTFNVTIDGQ